MNKEHLKELSTYPPFLYFKQYVEDEITKKQLSPLNRSEDIASEALGREIAAQIIRDVFNQVETLATKELDKKITYE